jgi:hypothetical protein
LIAACIFRAVWLSTTMRPKDAARLSPQCYRQRNWFDVVEGERETPPRGKKRGEPPKKRRPRGQGPFSLTVAAAGAMIGLSRTAAYRAVHAGQIPAIEVNGGFVVPKLPWLRMLGIPDTQPPAEEKTEIA